MNGRTSRRSKAFRPAGEPVEGRLLLTTLGSADTLQIFRDPRGFQADRPNTPVLPFAAKSTKATFIDPSVLITNGRHVVMGGHSYVAPFVHLDATSGFIKIGTASVIEDNSTIISDPNHTVPTTNVEIGDQVVIGYGAQVLGPSTIGAYGKASKLTSIGPNAVIDGATIEPGAIVGALATVGPGVTVPTGMAVLPGAKVTTNAEASNPALGLVTPVTSSQRSTIATTITDGGLLAGGYTTLYQGNSATGASAGTNVSGIYQGSLATIEGASSEPGSANTGSFEPTTAYSPQFVGPENTLYQASLFNFPARVIGQVIFGQTPSQVVNAIGRRNSIRADEGQPIRIGSIASTGTAVTINSPLGGTLTIGHNFVAGSNAVILSGTGTNAVIGDNVAIGAGAVVVQSSIGTGATIGAGAYVAQSKIAAGKTVAPGSIIINNVFKGFVTK
jgi:carbonic anhydrase/acetyltransferase-like protein (isoleucine patch superfamily)